MVCLSRIPWVSMYDILPIELHISSRLAPFFLIDHDLVGQSSVLGLSMFLQNYIKIEYV